MQSRITKITKQLIDNAIDDNASITSGSNSDKFLDKDEH